METATVTMTIERSTGPSGMGGGPVLKHLADTALPQPEDMIVETRGTKGEKPICARSAVCDVLGSSPDKYRVSTISPLRRPNSYFGTGRSMKKGNMKGGIKMHITGYEESSEARLQPMDDNFDAKRRGKPTEEIWKRVLTRESGANEGIVMKVVGHMAEFRTHVVSHNFHEAFAPLEEIRKVTGESRKLRDSALEQVDEMFTYEMSNAIPDNFETMIKLRNRISDILDEPLESESLDETFARNRWGSIKVLYRKQPEALTPQHLSQVALLAAQNKSWSDFLSSVELGANLIFKGPQSDKTSKRSPLHEALKSGEPPMDKLKVYFEKDPSLVNARNEDGLTPLHVVVGHGMPSTRLEHVKVLLEHGADINVQDNKDQTALQHVLYRGSTATAETDLIMAMLEATEHVAKHTWEPGTDQWTVLHVLCATALHQYIVPVVEKGADPCVLRNGLTLIDTVIIQDGMPLDLKQKMLETLLAEPVALGPFHATTVQARAVASKSSKYAPEYQTMMIGGMGYLYPLERLLFPLLSTAAVRALYRRFVLLLLEKGAVCPEEAKFIHSKLDQVHGKGEEFREPLEALIN